MTNDKWEMTNDQSPMSNGGPERHGRGWRPDISAITSGTHTSPVCFVAKANPASNPAHPCRLRAAATQLPSPSATITGSVNAVAEKRMAKGESTTATAAPVAAHRLR